MLLANGTELEFDQAGEWKEVETRTYAVPAAIIPAEIRQQVTAKYPNATIIKISRDRVDYEVDLSNGVELKFDRNTYRLIEVDKDDNDDNDQVVGYDQLPASAKAFISQHFPALKVVRVERENDDKGVTFDVRLSDGTELDFRANGEWKEVNTRTYAVPSAIVPSQITQQIANRYPGTQIFKISRDHKEYEVKLSNGREVTFNATTFVIIEDDND